LAGGPAGCPAEWADLLRACSRQAGRSYRRRGANALRRRASGPSVAFRLVGRRTPTGGRRPPVGLQAAGLAGGKALWGRGRVGAEVRTAIVEGFLAGTALARRRSDPLSAGAPSAATGLRNGPAARPVSRARGIAAARQAWIPDGANVSRARSSTRPAYEEVNSRYRRAQTEFSAPERGRMAGAGIRPGI
jgi:hypothetical protein